MIKEVLKNFNEVEIDHNPFGHKVINNIFPKNFYQSLIDNLPNIKEYIPIVKTDRVSSSYPPERFIFELNNESISKLNEKQQNIFNEIIKLFTDPIFFRIISEDFKEIIKKRINEFSDDEKIKFGTSNFNFSIGASLVKDLTKYKLGVHTDSPAKFLTFLFYLPKNDELKELGTALYKPKIKDFHLKKSVKGHHSVEDFNLIKKVDFLPNTLFIFPRTNYSYHGVQTVNIGNKERNLMLLNYYFKEIN